MLRCSHKWQHAHTCGISNEEDDDDDDDDDEEVEGPPFLKTRAHTFVWCLTDILFLRQAREERKSGRKVNEEMVVVAFLVCQFHTHMDGAVGSSCLPGGRRA